MKFIIPQNYNFKNKILGILDYQTAIFIVIWCSITFGLLHIFIKNWDIKIFLFISLLFKIKECYGGIPKLYLYKKF